MWTKTWKESNDPDRDTKLARIEHVSSTFPDRVFAFDEFGLSTRPQRTPASLGTTHTPRRLTNPANLCGHSTG